VQTAPLASGNARLNGVPGAGPKGGPVEIALTSEHEAALLGFVPGPIRARAMAGQAGWLSELRMVSLVLVGLPDLSHTTELATAQAVMEALQQSIYRYEGTINALSVDARGPVLLAALGLPPFAHEDDAARAVHAVLDMRARLRDLGVRGAMGMATGRIYCGAVGNRRRREYTLIGDVVNRAARLKQSTEDDVLCDEATVLAAGRLGTYRQTGLGFTSLPPLVAKGIEGPVPAYRPHTTAGAARAVDIRMVGRAAERAMLAEHLAALRNGGSSVTIVQGQAGIGKSLLVNELHDQADAAGARWLTAVGDAVEKTTPYRAWRTVMEQLFAIDVLDGDGEARRQKVLEWIGTNGDDLAAAPLLNDVLPLDLPESAETEALTGQARSDRTHRLVARLLQRAASAGPLLLVIEDAHWLDSLSWALLLRVARHVQPLMLVIATRPLVEPLPPGYVELVSAMRVTWLRLEELGAADAHALVCQRLGVEALPEEVARLIHEKAEGHPFFSEELAYALRDSGVIDTGGGRCVIAADVDLAAVSLPTTIEGVITSRIDRLAPSQQLALKVASVIGRVFSLRMLSEIHPLTTDSATLEDDLEMLHRLELTPREVTSPDLAYIFKHVITQEVAYNLMLFSQRRELHRRAGEWFERTYVDELASHYSWLAYHWTKADVKNKAIEYLRKAGEQAVRTNANDEAIAHFHEAIEILLTLPESPERNMEELELQLAVSAPLASTRGWSHPATERAYLRAAELSPLLGENAKTFWVIWGVWAFHLVRGHHVTAREVTVDLVRRAQAQDDPELGLEAGYAAAVSAFFLGDTATAIDVADKAMAAFDPIRATSQFITGQNGGVTSQCYLSLPLWHAGYADRSLAVMQRALELARTLDHPFSLTYALVHMGLVHQRRREPEAALDMAGAGLALAEEHGFAFFVAWASWVKGWALAQLGEQEAGIAVGQHGLDVYPATGSDVALSFGLGFLAESYLVAGRLDDARRVIDDAFAYVERTQERLYEAELHRLRGELWRRQGDTDLAARAFERAIEAARAHAAPAWELRALLSRARLDVSAASKQGVADLYVQFTEGFATADLVDARAFLEAPAVA
jgi:tetratricopeptide (TPR) repeat protein